MTDELTKWYLMKQSDGSVFGPMGLDQLRQWAVDAYIAPMDKISCDGQTWLKAPMLAELQMDYLLALASGENYGPTTVGAVREFLVIGEITQDTLVTNCRTGEEKSLREFPVFTVPTELPASASSGIKENLQARIMEVEKALLEERRYREQADAIFHRIAELEEALTEERLLREQANNLCIEMESRLAELETREATER
jgi:hypothetical protein